MVYLIILIKNKPPRTGRFLVFALADPPSTDHQTALLFHGSQPTQKIVSNSFSIERSFFNNRLFEK